MLRWDQDVPMVSEGNTEIFLPGRGRGGSTEKCDHDWSSTHKRQLGICIEYTYISELRVWVHRGKFSNLKLVKIPSLATLQVAEYMRTVKLCVWDLKEYNVSWKKVFFKFFGHQFSRAQKRSSTWKAACIRAGTWGEKLVWGHVKLLLGEVKYCEIYIFKLFCSFF